MTIEERHATLKAYRTPDFEHKKKIYEMNGMLDYLYPDRVTELIRKKYTLDSELALHRMRDEKPDEFEEYYNFAEACKVQARKEVYDEEIEPTELSATTRDYLAELERLGL